MACKEGHFCINCMKTDSSYNSLKCGKHSICTNCIVARIQSGHCHKCCEVCTSKPSSSKGQAGVWIFVDTSNLWIEAKKLQSKKRNFKSAEDPRVRIDAGKLAEIVANGRTINKVTIYGSNSPPTDSVWAKMKEKGWDVDIKYRSTVTHNGKQVDSQLARDVMAIATKTPTSERNTIVLATGDEDILALEKAIKEERWNTEVYMWGHAVATDLREFASEHEDRVEFRYFDNWLDRFTHISRRCKDLHLKSKTGIEENGIVFSMASCFFVTQISDEEWCQRLEEWCQRLEDIARWPFLYDWIPNSSFLVVSFCEDRGGIRFNSKKFLNSLKCTDYNELKVIVAQPFSEFQIENKIDRKIELTV